MYVVVNGVCINSYYDCDLAACNSCGLGYVLTNGVCIYQNYDCPDCSDSPGGSNCAVGFVYANGVCHYQQYSCVDCTSCPAGYILTNGACVYYYYSAVSYSNQNHGLLSKPYVSRVFRTRMSLTVTFGQPTEECINYKKHVTSLPTTNPTLATCMLFSCVIIVS